jgi:deaminated glutathione amidase
VPGKARGPSCGPSRLTSGGAIQGRVAYAAGMRVALCQLPVSSDPSVNLGRAQQALADAARSGAQLAVFPEGTQARFGTDLRAAAEPTDGAFCRGLSDAARDHGVAVVAGVFEPGPGRLVYNTAVMFDERGTLAAAYRKIHLFDALGQRESDQVAPGDEPVVAELGGLRVGVMTCYDIRFPEHARALLARRADLIVVPAGWAAGLFKEEHWVTLIRARAIENTVWVAAADQVPDPAEPPTRAPTGSGRSMLVDPMGTVRLDLGPRPGIAVGEVDMDVTAEVRAALPSLEHRRDDVFARPPVPALRD